MAVNQPDVEAIFNEALAKQPDERGAFLDAVCGGDVALRRRVEQFLAAQADIGSFLEAPAVALPAPVATVEMQIAESPGAVIGPYQLVEQIGEGGFGVVFMAEQIQPVRRRVALKILKPGMDTRQVVARFEAERQALAIMDHPNIAKVLDGGATATGRPYFVMELVKGVPITEYCDQNHLTPRQRLELFIPVCQAVQHAHQKGIIHRDIKPSNVLIADYDNRPMPKVIDFGVAKATGPELTQETLQTGFGAVVGTVEYMSPEQASLNQVDVDTRTDIYSLGVLLYELLTGTTPLDRKRLKTTPLLDVLRSIREDDTVRPSARLSTVEELPAIAANRGLEPKKLSGLMRGELDWIVMKALDKDRGRRYETADGLAADVHHYLSDEPVEACPPTAMYRFRKFARRNKAALGTVAVAILAVLTVAVVASLSAFWLNEEQRATQRQLDETRKAELRATHNFDQAEGQRKIAQRLARERSEELLRMRVAQGIRHMEDNDRLAALPWLTAALEGDQENIGRARIHRTRLAAVLQKAPRLVQMMSHAAAVTSVEFSTDGGRLVSASKDGSARVWHVETGQAITPPLRHDDWVAVAFFSPDGKGVVTASYDFSARIWDAATGEQRFRLKHAAAVLYASFCPKGERVATACVDGTARVWNAQTGEPVTPVLQHAFPVNQATFSPDGKFVLTACARFRPPGTHEGEARVWDAASGAPVETLSPGTGVSQAWFLPDSRRVVTANTNGPAAVGEIGKAKRDPLPPDGKKKVVPANKTGPGSLWEIGNTSSVRLQETVPAGLVDISPDARYVLAANQYGSARVYHVATGQPAGAELKHPSIILATRYCGDGHVLTAAGDGLVRYWHPTKAALARPPLHHAAAVNWVAHRRAGSLVATAGQNGLVFVWDLGVPDGMSAAPKTIAGVKKAVTGLPEKLALDPNRFVGHWVSYSPDGRYLLAGGGTQPTRIRDQATGNVQILETPAELPWRPNCAHATFSPHGDRVLACYYDGTARVWHLATGKATVCPLRHADSAVHGEFSPDGRLVVTAGQDGIVQVWEAATGKPACQPLKGPGSAGHAAFHPDGRTVVVCRWRVAQLWDTHTGKVVALPHPNGISWAAFSPDGHRVATACSDGTGRLWETASGREITPPLQHNAMVTQITFSKDGQRVLTASLDNMARVWDPATGQAITPFLRHEARVISAVFSADGRFVLTASRDATARVWDAATGEPVTPPLRHSAGLNVAAFRPDGKQLVSAGINGEIAVRDLPADDRPVEDLIRLAQVMSGRRFDALGQMQHLTAPEYQERWRTLQENKK